jgi:hypothetical protein
MMDSPAFDYESMSSFSEDQNSSDDEIINAAIRSEQSEWIDFDEPDYDCEESSSRPGSQVEDDCASETPVDQITNRGLLGYLSYPSSNQSATLIGSIVSLKSGLLVIIHAKIRRKTLGRNAYPEDARRGGLYIGHYVEIVPPITFFKGKTLPESYQCWLIEPWLKVALLYQDEIEVTLANSVPLSSYAGHYSELALCDKPNRTPISIANFLVTRTRMMHLRPADILSVIFSFKFGDRLYYTTIVPLLNINGGGNWPSIIQQIVLNENDVEYITFNEPIISEHCCAACGVHKPIQHLVRLNVNSRVLMDTHRAAGNTSRAQNNILKAPEGVEILMGSKCFARVALAREIIQYLLRSIAQQKPLHFDTLIAYEMRVVHLI